ncbi:ammonium transporter [Desulfurobacterium thermolithotrophum DSM 11699]|uniref:Ammonium transporter n=1 Tax=Desulfurobacterium thermolithotrophum (strain DSM 11699 / BSA) TaxID=868864 RepID=F0S0G1_DESTD|nr:ammonium transporter [Desulfurobacterium thermolithotrophum]ADY72689.1 ammonium transporter [Desulfurobacterium thermolithotrophum DSM 11699]
MKRILGVLLMALTPLAAMAEETPTLNSGDTAWMLVSTALVMLMTPAGLALFYGGMTRSKNILNTIGMSFLAYCVASVVWVLWGYTLAFGPDIGGFIGGLEKVFMKGVGVETLSGTIPEFLFAAFQGTFAAITVALASGAVIERLKFSTWFIFTVLWVTVVYAPVAHWVWGGGFLGNDGALDFAGGTVVHINAGIAGLVMALLLGKRKGYGKTAFFPSSVVLTVLGAALLWFGWFGFNAGSELAADGVAASAFLVTNVAASMAAISWIVTEWIMLRKPTLLGAASGAVAGLVAITPAAGFVDVTGAIVIGLVAGILGWFGVFVLKKKLGYDDSLDAFGVHGLCGVWGAIATGIFAVKTIGGTPGVLEGNLPQLWIQLKAVIATIVYSGIMTAVVYFVSSILTGGARVSEEEEIEGLDSAIHGEKGFNL